MRALAILTMLAGASLTTRALPPTETAAAEHAKAGREAEQRNDFATAVREYGEVAKLYPDSAEAQSNLGVALYFNGQLRQAVAIFRKAIVSNPNLLTPHLFSGLAFYRLSNPDAAVPELAAAARTNPSDVLSHTWLGYAYVAEFRYDLALREFQIASQLEPRNIDVWYALGQTYLQLGKDATASLLSTASDGARVWQLAGEQAEIQSDRPKALEDYLGALKRRPELTDVRSAMTRLGGIVPPLTVNTSGERGASEKADEDEWYREAHDAEGRASAAFERVGQLAPDSYRAHQILGDSLTAQGRLEEADAEYRAVLTQKSDLPGIHQAIGGNLVRTGKLAEALGEFKAEMAIEPRSAVAHTHAGQVLLLLGDDEDASKMLVSAQAMDRPPADLFRLLGKLELRRKNYRAAADALAHYISLRKGDASAYYLLSKAYAGLGEQESMKRALATFERISRDAKARNQAQTELAQFSKSHQEPDEDADLTNGPRQ